MAVSVGVEAAVVVIAAPFLALNCCWVNYHQDVVMSNFPRYTMSMATMPPLWLTEEEQRAWRAYGRAARLLFAQLDHDLYRDAGMAPGAYELLVVLSEAPNRAMRMNELAEATLTSPSRITHAVGRLVDLGWVERATCPSDR